MSNVAKSDRQKSEVEFLRAARDVKITTIRKCNRIPKKLWRGLAEPMISQASYAKACIIQANSIYPQRAGEAADRQRAFKNAKATLYALCGSVDDLMEIRDEISMGYEAIDEWTRKITVLIGLIDGVMDSDRRRFQNLPV